MIDVSQIIAGPTVARILADFGASVLKIANPRSPTPVDHLFINRGKEMALIDVRTDEGLDILHRLVDRADVLVQNFTRGRAEEFGMGYAELAQRRPELVYCSLSAYGYGGPWGAGRGYEPLGQTVTGLTRRFGGAEQPRYQPMRRVADYGAGILGAFGVALALFERRRSGEGQHVETSLAHASTFHQVPFLFGFEGERESEPEGQGARGCGPLHRLYRASDAWFFLAGAAAGDAAWTEIPALSGLAGLSGDALEAGLEARIAREPVSVWLPRLRAAGVEAMACRTVSEMLDDPYALSRGLSVRATYERSAVRTVGPAPRLSRTPALPVRLPRAYGADTVTILRELGLGQRVDDLAARGIAVSAPIASEAERETASPRR